MTFSNILKNESGASTVIETVLLFAISVIFLGIIYTSFQGLNDRQTEIVMKEQYLSIGNDIANKISDMTIYAKASLSDGATINIQSDIYMPLLIADNPYSVKMATGKIIFESTGGPYVKVNIPISNDINIADNSTIFSTGDTFELMYDSQSGAIFFSEGGVIPPPDFNAPTISFISPDEEEIISNTTFINVSTWDDVGVTKVQYYVDEIYQYTSGEDWLWDTTTMSDGTYNVTAIAYDSAGHSKAATRKFTLNNGISFPPAITIISPTDNESTDFRRPVIKFKITDDIGIDFGSIILLVDGVNRISNVTFSTVNTKLTTLTYIPSSNMNISDHSVEVHVNDTDGTIHETVAYWDFTIDAIIDSDNPAVSIDWPGMDSDLVPGSVVKMTYTASDASSGIDNITLNVTRNDGLFYTHFQQVAEYPIIIKNTGSISWPFDPDILIEGKNYTYNMKVYDRSGKNKSATAGPFKVLSTGQASKLVEDTGSVSVAGTQVNNIQIKKSSGTVSLSKITVIWTPTNSSQKITRIDIDGSTYWNGNSESGIVLTLTSPYTVRSSFKSIDLSFNYSMSGKAFTIVFQMSDSTTKTITFNT
ncbi:MAG: Ig-like domain-containing protein [Candidatus Methanoperedens sp.]|nr:Ig-like domain-containing protein [Candidatus Methanoperedens sp.]